MAGTERIAAKTNPEDGHEAEVGAHLVGVAGAGVEVGKGAEVGTGDGAGIGISSRETGRGIVGRAAGTGMVDAHGIEAVVPVVIVGVDC